MSGLTRRSLEHWVILGGALLALIAVIVLGTWVEPDPRGHGTHEQFGMPPCRMLQFTSIPCPGCGVTTSVALAAHGQFAASFWNQPFGLFMALAVPIVAIFALVQHARCRDLGQVLRAMYLRWWMLGIGLVALAGWAWKAAAMRGWVG